MKFPDHSQHFDIRHNNYNGYLKLMVRWPLKTR
jgi:hypothetical protein